MPINLGALPGLFDFSLGRSSAINQQNALLQNDAQRTSNFIDQLNALNTSLATNDNLEFRRGFAAQPQGTSILDRFNNFSASTTNPFALQQSVVQGQSLAPLVATAGVQSPAFGVGQGLPGTFQGALGQGLLGANPFFQQQANNNISNLVAQSNPGLETNTLSNLLLAAFGQNQQNTVDQTVGNEIADLRAQIAALTNGGTTSASATPANGPNTAAPNRVNTAPVLPQILPTTTSLNGAQANSRVQ